MHVSIDGHVDSVQSLSSPGETLNQQNDTGHLDGPRIDKGRLHAAFFACWVHPNTDNGYANQTYQLLDHVEHAAEVAGVRHVGIGSDFDGADAFPGEITSCADLPLLRDVLSDRGWSESEINRVFEGNFLRALEASERLATKEINMV